jgi:hypothetical protein
MRTKPLEYSEMADLVDEAMKPIFDKTDHNYPYCYGNLVSWFWDAIRMLPATKQRAFLDRMIRMNSTLKPVGFEVNHD